MVVPQVDPVVWPAEGCTAAAAHGHPLGDAEVESYAKNGYLMRRQVFSPEEVSQSAM